MLRQQGMKAPLRVTDPRLASLPMVEQALQYCRDAGLRLGLFSAIKGNPTGGNVAAGIGSELGQAVIITDKGKHIKRPISHLKVVPGMVILDPELTVGLPPNLTADKGMDALAHNLEAYCTPLYHRMAEAIALELRRRLTPRACDLCYFPGQQWPVYLWFAGGLR